MNEETNGTSWDFFLDSLLMFEKKKLTFTFDDEVKSIETLNKVKNINELCIKWINSLTKNTKNETKSNELRQNGNDVFKSKKDHFLAIETYSKAIFYAPEASKALPLAYGNRGIVLMELKQFTEAYNDCQEAINCGYPAANLLRIFFRQADCAKQLNDTEKFRKALDSLEKQANTKCFTKAESEKLSDLKKELLAMESKETAVEPSLKDERKEPVEQQQTPPKLIEKFGPLVDRYVVSGTKLVENSLICTEKAFAFVPVYESNYPNFDCQKCAKVNVIPFPCNKCGRAFYCGPTCRLNHSDIHKFECFGYRKDLWKQIGIAHLCMRTFLVGFKECLDKLSSKKFSSALDMFDEMKIMSEEGHMNYQYGKVFRLVTNFDRMLPQDNSSVLFALTAFMLTIYLEDSTNFFEQIPEKSLNLLPNKSEWKLFISAVIFRHAGQLVCNGHAITEFRAVLPSERKCRKDQSLEVVLGSLSESIYSARSFTGIFPKISLFNHSCNPNIRNSFDKDTLTVYAAKTIQEGGEIFNCYGPNYKLMKKKERKKILKSQYCFDCKCQKCVLNNYDEDCKTYVTFFCSCGNKLFIYDINKDDCAVRCQECMVIFDTEWYTCIFKKFENTLGLNIEENPAEVFEKVMSMYEIGKRRMSKLNITKLAMGLRIITLFQSFSGINYHIFEELLKISLEVLECQKHRFGISSPEFIESCLPFIDLLAIKNEFKHPFKITDYQTYILNMFVKSLQIVSGDTRKFFLNYMEEHGILKE